MRQIERNRKPSHVVRRKPLFGQPDVGPEGDRTHIHLAIKLLDPLFQTRPVNPQWKVAKAKVQELAVGQPVQFACHDFILKNFANPHETSGLTRGFFMNYLEHCCWEFLVGFR